VRKNVVRGADRVSAASRALLDEVLGDHSERDDLVVVFSPPRSIAPCSPCLQKRCARSAGSSRTEALSWENETRLPRAHRLCRYDKRCS
jgi:hypothetical protein